MVDELKGEQGLSVVHGNRRGGEETEETHDEGTGLISLPPQLFPLKASPDEFTVGGSGEKIEKHGEFEVPGKRGTCTRR